LNKPRDMSLEEYVEYLEAKVARLEAFINSLRERGVEVPPWVVEEPRQKPDYYGVQKAMEQAKRVVLKACIALDKEGVKIFKPEQVLRKVRQFDNRVSTYTVDRALRALADEREYYPFPPPIKRVGHGEYMLHPEVKYEDLGVKPMTLDSYLARKT